MTANMEQDAVHRPAVSVGALSVVGKVRDENQDRTNQSRLPMGDLCVVADGMGGYQGGAAAATIAVETIERVCKEAGESASPLTTIQSAIQAANLEINKQASAGKPEFVKMGSTAVAVLIRNGVAHVGHVGDSRAYLARQGELAQLTVDHTVAQQLVEAGVLREDEARDHEDSSKLTRVLGPKPEVDVDLEPPIALEYGDGILLCSDGLSGYVGNSEIQQVIYRGGRAQEIAERLVDLAMAAGGEDNISVQFVRYGDPEPKTIAEEGPPRENNERRGPRWKLLGSLAAAAILASAGILGYVGSRIPVPPPIPAGPTAVIPPPSAGRPTGSAINLSPAATAAPDVIGKLQQQIDDLTARVHKLENAARQPAPSNAGRKTPAGPQSGSANGRNGNAGGRGGVSSPPAAPPSGEDPAVAEGGANNTAPGGEGGGRSPAPPKTDKPETPKGDATKADTTKGETKKGDDKTGKR